jgi:hypothetical protein
MSFAVTPVTTLAAAVANGATVLVAYPAGRVQADFIGANLATNTGSLVLNGNEIYPEAAAGVRVNFTYNAGDVTVTNNTGVAWPAGSTIRAQFGRAGNDRPGFVQPGPVVTALTTAFGTAADTLVDVTATPTQATINNNFASVVRRIDRLELALRANGLIG